MRVTKLECEAYRGFSNVTIEFDPRLTVLVGANGVGKSSILDALHLLLSQYSARLVGSPGAASKLKETDVRHGSGQTSLRLSAIDDRVGPLRWTLFKQGPVERILRPHSSELTGLNSFVRTVVGSQEDDADYLRGETLPVYYDQSRSILKIPQRRRQKGDDAAGAVFRDSLRTWGIDFPKLTYWFQDRETDELRRQKVNPAYVDNQLRAVRRAITTATGFKNPYFSVDRPRGLTLSKGKVELHVSQLSTGEQVFMALAADLARRLASVARSGQDPLQAGAIVLIDELELHLHPKWQRTIVPWLLRTFPNCQFIVSTHSPQVLSEVHASHIRVLTESSRGTGMVGAQASFGRDSNHLLLSLFEVEERRPATRHLIAQADSAITQGDAARARELIADLRDQLEGSAPEISVLEARLARRGSSNP